MVCRLAVTTCSAGTEQAESGSEGHHSKVFHVRQLCRTAFRLHSSCACYRRHGRPKGDQGQRGGGLKKGEGVLQQGGVAGQSRVGWYWRSSEGSMKVSRETVGPQAAGLAEAGLAGQGRGSRAGQGRAEAGGHKAGQGKIKNKESKLEAEHSSAGNGDLQSNPHLYQHNACLCLWLVFGSSLTAPASFW